MLQQPPQNQHAQAGPPLCDRPGAGTAATAAQGYVVFNGDAEEFGEFRDGVLHLPESEVPLGFTGGEFDPLALEGAMEILARDYPTETDLRT
eukprot:5610431-Alexandrium_andersonii.AAC.1